jgi:hypothetical protein
LDEKGEKGAGLGPSRIDIMRHSFQGGITYSPLYATECIEGELNGLRPLPWLYFLFLFFRLKCLLLK